MAIIIEQTKSYLNRVYPALKNWLPCKEQQSAGTTNTITDYASGQALAGARNLDKTDAATIFGLQIDGTAGQGNDFDDNTIWLNDVGVNESFIALQVMDNQDDANAYNWWGPSGGATGIYMANAGGLPTVIAQEETITDTNPATPTGIICMYVGYNRSTSTFEFGHITSAGTVTTKRSVASTALSEKILDFGIAPNNNGFSLYGGTGGANPLTIYNALFARFSGQFPVYEGDDGFSQEMVQWRLDNIAGIKNIPPFIKELR